MTAFATRVSNFSRAGFYIGLGRLGIAWSLAWCLVAGAVRAADPDFGPNVFIFDSTNASQLEAKFDSYFGKQLSNEFGKERYAFLLKPGKYNGQLNMGFYTQICGLGKSPDDVTLTGEIHCDGRWDKGNVTRNFWRDVENLAIVPAAGKSNLWGVSQAAPFRRVHVEGNLALSAGGYASGGFISDSKVDGAINSGSQQQWYTRSSELGSWKGGVWNMVFEGVINPPQGDWASGKPNTIVDKVPLIREKPFLMVEGDKWSVFVPALRKDTAGCTWTSGPAQGESIPIEQFYIAHADKDTSATLNDALRQGKNLLLTPGIYDLDDTIKVDRANTVVLGLGLATLQPTKGNSAMEVADVSGVKIAGVLFDAGPTPSPMLLQIGPPGSSQSHADNPTIIYDIFGRIGGAKVGKTKAGVIINSNDVIGDHAWIWRADHGAGVGWNANTAINGLIVNGANVSYHGLFVEHFQEYQTLWNGENGRVCFYQCEMPYDPPGGGWKNGAENGYPGFKVADTVKTFEGYGLGIYAFFKGAGNADNAMEVPKAAGVKIHHVMSFGKGIKNVIDGTNGPKTKVVQFPG